MNNVYDVIIIGSGPGGLSAGIYAGRSKLKTLIIEKKAFGGQILNTGVIENYPGSIKDETGSSLAQRMLNQCMEFGAELVKDEVLEVDLQGSIKTIKCKNNIYKSKAIIIATGSERKKLNLDRESDFLGMGISNCAICDGHLFEDLPVYVVGGGESAVKEGMYLSKFAKKVTILNKYDKLKCSKYMEDKLKDFHNISIINNVKVVKLLGEDILNGIVIEDLKSNKQITINATEEDDYIMGLFVFVGLKAQTSLFKNVLDLDEGGYIKTDNNMETNIRGVYAVGDCRASSLKQIVTAVNDGAIAAVNVEKYIN